MRKRAEMRVRDQERERSARSGQAFHHQPGAAFGDVRDDGRATVNFRDDAEIDREGEMNGGALLEAEVRSFDEHAIRAQIARSTQLACASRNGDVDRRTGTMTCV